MHILICGKLNTFARQLIRRLYQDKHEIYVLRDPSDRSPKENRVFQEYRFTLSNENISSVVASAKPDLMILLGAADTQITWQHKDKDSTDFILGMTRLLMAAKDADVERIIYISSSEMFELNQESRITRETVPVTNSARMNAIQQVESVLLNDQRESGRITVVRLPQVVSGYDSTYEGNVWLRMAMETLYEASVHCVKDAKHSMIDFRDAADVIFKIVRLPDSRRESLYMIQGVLCTEQEIVDKLQYSKLGIKTAVIYDTVSAADYPPERIMDFQNEDLHFSLRYSLDQTMEYLFNDCQKATQNQDKGRKKWKNILPFIESLVAVLLALWGTYVLKDSIFSENMDLFIIYVALFASVYGIAYGLLASFLGGIALVIMSVLEGVLYSNLTGYGLFIHFLMLVVIGVIAGFMRDKYFRRNRNLEDETEYLSNEVSDLSRINDGNAYIKDIYEKRLINYQNSLARIYELTTQLDFTIPQKVVFQSVKVLKELMEMDHIAIYLISNPGSPYYRLAASTSESAAVCGKSLKLDENSFLYSSIMRREVYCNRTMEGNLPTYACGVGSSGDVLAIVMLWTPNIDKINTYETDMLSLLCKLVEKSMRRAIDFETAIRENAFIGSTRIMKEDAFLSIYRIWRDGLKQHLFVYTLLQVDPKGQSVEVLQRSTRNNDVLGMVKGIPYVMLSSTTEQEATIVVKRLRERGMFAMTLDSDYFDEDIKDES